MNAADATPSPSSSAPAQLSGDSTAAARAVATAVAVSQLARRVAPLSQLALVFVVALLVVSIGNTHQFWDRDEPRYAEASRTMIATGDYVMPMHDGEPRYKKPVLIYWLQAASYTVFGATEAAARLPSGLATALTCVLLFSWVYRRTGRRRPAWLAAMSFLLCTMTLVQGRASTIDATLVFAITALMLLWIDLIGDRASLPLRRGWWLVFYAALGVATLLKGPTVLATFGPAVAMYLAWHWREVLHWAPPVRIASWWPHLAGGGAALAIVLPWGLAINSATGGAFFDEFIGVDVIARAAQAQEGHGGPPVYYLPVVLGMFFPWILLLLANLRHLDGALDRRHVRWLICWAVAPFVAISLMATKLPHYVYPIFPALAVLTGVALDRALAEQATHGRPHPPTIAEDGRPYHARRAGRYALIGAYALVALVLSIGPVLAALAMGLGSLLPQAIAIGVVVGLTSLYGARQLAIGDHRTATRMGLVAMGGLALIGPWLALSFDRYKPARPLGELIRADADANPELHTITRGFEGYPVPAKDVQPLHAFGYDESSLPFYTGHQTLTEIRWERLDELVSAATPASPKLLLIAYFEPDGYSRGDPIDIATADPVRRPRKTDDIAHIRAVLARADRIGTVGPLFHYNRGRERWQVLELYRIDGDEADGGSGHR